MKNVIKFLLFLTYSTCIFFLPNNYFILVPIFINLIIIIFSKVKINKLIIKSINILPFILFVLIINLFLDNYINALLTAVKLIIVCTITITYSETTSMLRYSRIN